MTKFAPIHPGEILQSEFLDELGIAERVQISKQVNTGTPTHASIAPPEAQISKQVNTGTPTGVAERVQISKQVNTGTPTGTGYLAVDRGRGSLLQGQFFTQLYAPLVERVDSPNDAFYEDFVFVDGY